MIVVAAAESATATRIWNCLPASPALPTKVCELQLPEELTTAACGCGLKWLPPGFCVNTQIFSPGRRLRAVPCTRIAWATVAGGVCLAGKVISTRTGPGCGGGLVCAPCLITDTWPYGCAPAGSLGSPGKLPVRLALAR